MKFHWSASIIAASVGSAAALFATAATPTAIAATPAAVAGGSSAASGDATVASGSPAYGGDAGGTRYSALAQINAGNVEDLRLAWEFRTGELGDGVKDWSRSAFEATPILYDGSLYFTTSATDVLAVDAATGHLRWLGWAQRLKRVFGIEIQRCEHCGGTVRIIGARVTVGHQRFIRVIPNRCAARRL